MVRVGFCFLLLATPARAGVAAPKKPTKEAPPRITVHDFDAVKVEATAARPWSWFIDGRRSAEFESLIDLRTHFDREMKATVTEIQ